MAQVTFTSDVNWSGQGVLSTAHIGDKVVTIDEPESLGGTDQAPNPVEYILASLGGCINVIVVMLADQHNVILNGISVHVEGDLDLDGFMEKDPNVRPGFQQIRYRIEIDSPSPSHQIEELIKHAERICPVKDTLRGVPTLSIQK
ncbi:OsmC family protein [Melghirimyces algeriensis]|uniref:Uncharacterized OsmC-related protein n=1 Tax=Melghirimyces algeriensis TaxID=910412 RepID=A0A521C161_9BACL|nr:OsmC family protein [Melghirimyces algeriensis]SMO53105.1 Uncharacterized OsmC-related protein [Melghirimyces algeriensis]